MRAQHFRRITGALLILGAIAVNVPYTLLMMDFDYPDILREPAGEILTRFAAGGPGLVWTWLAFAWVGLPILLSVSLLQQRRIPRWLPWAGFAAAGVYELAQGELLATAIPGFPVLAPAGLVGSLMWLGWLVALGVVLIRPTRSTVYEHAGQDPQLGVSAVQ